MRTRLAIAVALVLVVSFTVLGAVFVQTTRATLVNQVDERVLEGGEWAEKRRGGGPHGSPGDGREPPESISGPAGKPAAPTPASGLFERPEAQFVYGPDGDLLSAELSGRVDDPDPPPQLPSIPSAELDAMIGRVVTVPAIEGTLRYRMLVQRGRSGDILVTAAPLAGVDAAISQLIRSLLVVGAIALAGATAISWWLIRRGLRPVDQMVDTAAAIAGGDLGQRVPDANSRTELGRLGAALNEMLHQIEGAMQARTASEERLRRFVADAAHELRTPLTSLRGYAELYRQGALPDAVAVDGAMGRIEAEGARMARLVDDLLLLARLDQQRGLETRPVDIVAVVQEAVADVKAVEPNRSLTLVAAGDAVVQGDRARLRQVIDNLLVNARTHTPPGTPVQVTVATTAGHVEVAVKDEGPGIAIADQARVFERFWRGDPSRVRSRGGSGLGLAIVASLVQAHGGSVDVTSEPGHGATFTVRLPLLEPKPTSVDAASTRGEIRRRHAAPSREAASG